MRKYKCAFAPVRLSDDPCEGRVHLALWTPPPGRGGEVYPLAAEWRCNAHSVNPRLVPDLRVYYPGTPEFEEILPEAMELMLGG